MTTSSQEANGDEFSYNPKMPCGEEVVISGISGIFPNSNNVSEFMKNLYDKVDMVIYDDMLFNHPEAPKHVGKIKGTKKFDAQFFRVTYNQAFSLEPMCRKILENSYSAIFDAGVNPLEFKGTKLGVYVGTQYMDSSNKTLYNTYRKNGFIISGGSKCMFSNRISYFLDGKAPSVTVDCSCASTMVCLEQAYQDMKSGICESALVGGCQLCSHPVLSLNLRRCGFLCLDGKTKCFDKKSDGYVRSEVINVVFLQKAKDAKRIYAEICQAKTTYGLKVGSEFVPFRKTEEIRSFLEEFYSHVAISPKEVEYVEAHGAATVLADTNEIQAIDDVFGGNRSVMVGCVKSNMGNSEPASGICALIKLCLAYQKGKLPANLHYSQPLDIPAVKDGRIKILTENEPFKRGYTAINNFSFTGMNCHILLKGHYKRKNIQRYECNIPRLVFVSGRHDEGLQKTFETLKNEPLDPEVIGMLHNIYKLDNIGHIARGYAIFDTNENQETKLLAQSVESYPGTKRPLWLVYSGMGSQWAGMGAELMRIPIFASAIEKCRKILEPKGVDIVRIITEPDASFDYILNCFVGIAAVQIGLTDILKELGIVPDYIIGHSVGEMGCAYFDGCFSTEEMILAAYTRGKVSVETDFIKGAMAAVGLGYSEVTRIVPPEIDIACHNSFESCTVSGPADIVRSFVQELKSKGVFAKEVPSANIAYHSRYIEKAAPDFLKRMCEVLNKSVKRSEKWISTSVPRDKWAEPMAKLSSPEYHTNNLLNPVYFEESARLISSNAVIVEVAPHGLLQAILKRSHPTCTHIPLTNRGNTNPIRYLFEAFGKLYQAGFNSNIDKLYPKIEFPVSTETPSISHLVEWYHNEDWALTIEDAKATLNTPTRRLALCLEDDDFKFIAGHVIEENIIFPEAAIFIMLWETLAMYKNIHYEEMSVCFKDVQIYEEIIIEYKTPLKINFMITKGSHRFEVTRGNILIADGYINDYVEETHNENEFLNENHTVFFDSQDIYNIFLNKGYNFKDSFKSILSSSFTWNTAKVKWMGNWTIFLDSILQCNILARNYNGISKPTVIKLIAIDVKEHMKHTAAIVEDNEGLTVQLHKYNGVTRCGGVVIKDIVFYDKPFHDKEPDILNELSFVPYYMIGQVDNQLALHINLQTVVDNVPEKEIMVLTYKNANEIFDLNLNELIETVIENIPDANFKIATLENNNMEPIASSNLLITKNFITHSKYDLISSFIGRDTFVLTIEENYSGLKKYEMDYKVISKMTVEGQLLILLRKPSFSKENVVFISVTDDNPLSWITNLQTEIKKQKKVVFICEKPTHCGLIGFVKNANKKYENKISLVVVNDSEVISLNQKSELFQKQLEKNLTFNILNKDKWGSYYNLPYSRYQGNINNCEIMLVNTKIGGKNNIQWAEIEPKVDFNNSIQVYYSGPYLKDTKIVLGENMDNKVFTMDFSGKDNKGNRVMGLIAGGTLASIVQADPYLLWPVPAYWTLEEAATVPLPYVQAVYCLLVKNQLQPTQSVFVTDGIEAFGQAVISICLKIGCTIFTSVDNDYKKKILMNLFPQLNENFVGLSSDLSFYTNIVIGSQNELCDLVLNNYSGDLREIAMKCVAANGNFLDINSTDMISNKHFGMSYVKNRRSYYAVNVSNLFRLQHTDERKIIQTVISEGIASGYIRPISNVTYSVDEVSKALRFLSLNKHIGKVVIKIKDKNKISMISRMSFSSDGNYLVVCNKNTIGIDLANRLVERGARNLTLTMKSQKITGYLRALMVTWKKCGVNVKISRKSLQTESDCVEFIKDENYILPISAIFVVQDQCESYHANHQDFLKMKDEVISLVSNLDRISMNNCPELRYFVVISHTSRNVVDEYTASALESICQNRANIGLPSLILRIAVPIEECSKSSFLQIQSQSTATTLNALETSLRGNCTNVLTYNTKKKQHYNILTKFSNILAVQNLNEIDGKLLLKQIVPNDIILEEIKLALKESNNNELTIEELRDTTIDRLKELAYVKEKRATNFHGGLGAFYTHIETDEYMASEVIVPMNTLTNKSEKEEDLDANENYLMLIPGFEGHHQVFMSLCERLKISALTLQLGPDYYKYSIKEMALDIKMHITKRFTMKSKFYLLGYSFGINVALELAALLEKDGLLGVIYCLDSSPDALRIQIKAYLGGLSDDQLQNTILEHCFYLLSGCRSENLLNLAESYDDWSQKVSKCKEHLKNLVPCTNQYVESVLECAYQRLLLAKTYEPDLKLDSELVLLRGVPHPKSEILPPDYNLSKYSKKPVKVFDITSDTACAPNDNMIPNIVNRLLGTDILNDFRKKNVCDTYTTAILRVE